MSEITPEQATSLLNAINNFKYGTWFGLLCVMVVAAIIYLIWYKINTSKNREEQALVEAHKNERAKLYADAIHGLRASVDDLKVTMQEHTVQEQQNVATIEGMVRGIDTTVSSVREIASYVATVATGSIAFDDSLKIVEDAFNRGIVFEVCGVINTSLIENDYVGRQEFVERKVKTAIGEVLQESCEYLSSLSLPFGPKVFFTLNTTHVATRYELCDQIWLAVEPLFRSNMDKLKKMEECKLLIFNCVHDYFESVKKKLRQTGSTSSQFRALIHTPKPGGP